MSVQTVHDISSDLTAVSRIDAIPTILEVVCRITGLGFAAVARVTTDRWVAAAVRDEIAYGVVAGGELILETTMCNEIRHTGETIAIDHVAKDPRFCDHPTPKRYGFQSYISVPIILRDGEFFGTLFAIDPKPAHVRRPDVVAMCTLFAQLIASHLDQQRLVDDLEAEVARRTADLREDRRSLRALAGRLQRVREDERTALARELHDEFAQVLTKLKLDLGAIRRDVEQPRPDADTLETLGSMEDTLGTMLGGLHRIVSDLRPVIFDALGFVAAATVSVRDVERRNGIHASFEGDPTLRLPEEIGIAFFRVLQEALTNVTRHARASTVKVSLCVEDGGIVLRVADDGCGIARGATRKPTAFGVKGMEERLRALGGSFELSARATGGTELVARVPAARADA
jgi:signal transduction histidine kinase